MALLNLFSTLYRTNIAQERDGAKICNSYSCETYFTISNKMQRTKNLSDQQYS